MKDKLLRKGLVLGIIVLFVGAGIIPSTIGNIEKKTTSTGLNSRGYIQDLIDNASNGDTIYIPSGTYYENIIINKSISLVGEDKDTTIIDGGGSGDVVYVSADCVNISGFTIQNSIENAILLDSCNDCTISDNVMHNSNFAIKLVDANNNQIKNCQIYNNIWGINIGSNIGASAENNIITNCQISNNALLGLHLFNSANNTIQGNNFISDGIVIAGSLEDCNQNIDTTNTVNGKPLYYFLNEKDMTIDGWDIGQLILVNCTGFSIKNIEISGTDSGITMISSSYNSISNCTIFDNLFGVGLINSSYNTLENNIAKNNIGFMIPGSGWPSSGISIIGSHNIIRNNNASNNLIGIAILFFSSLPSFASEGNIIDGNKIYSNNYSGILVLDSLDNFIYHNNFINNTQNAYDNGTNIWDDGKRGNFWDDYKEKYPNASKIWWKGIWDTPYEIPGGDNKDKCPLIKQWPGPVSKTVPINKPINFNFNLLEWLFERFPNAFPILRHLLGL